MTAISAGLLSARISSTIGGRFRVTFVFTIEPEFRIPEERMFIRLEDMIVITESGARILSDFVPRSIAGVEKLMAEDGLLQKYGRIR